MGEAGLVSAKPCERAQECFKFSSSQYGQEKKFLRADSGSVGILLACVPKHAKVTVFAAHLRLRYEVPAEVPTGFFEESPVWH